MVQFIIVNIVLLMIVINLIYFLVYLWANAMDKADQIARMFVTVIIGIVCLLIISLEFSMYNNWVDEKEFAVISSEEFYNPITEKTSYIVYVQTEGIVYKLEVPPAEIDRFEEDFESTMLGLENGGVKIIKRVETGISSITEIKEN